MNPRKVPIELQNLTDAEISLLTPVISYLKFKRLKGGQHASTGHFAAFEQNITEIANTLPHKKTNMVIFRRKGDGESKDKDFIVRRNKYVVAFKWLKENM